MTANRILSSGMPSPRRMALPICSLPLGGLSDLGRVLRSAGHDNRAGAVRQGGQEHLQSDMADLFHFEIDPVVMISLIHP